MRDLAPKQARFVEEYLVDLNATQAAIRAGYSQRTANEQGARLLANVSVRSLISEAKSRLSERTGRTVAAVMADIGRVRDDAMREVEDQQTGERSMLSHKDALKALELEGKHLGAFQDRLDISNRDGTMRPTLIKIVAQR